ncbi:hypothetical protein D3C71_1551530 [compost metagenome]
MHAFQHAARQRGVAVDAARAGQNARAADRHVATQDAVISQAAARDGDGTAQCVRHLQGTSLNLRLAAEAAAVSQQLQCARAGLRDLSRARQHAAKRRAAGLVEARQGARCDVGIAVVAAGTDGQRAGIDAPVLCAKAGQRQRTHALLGHRARAGDIARVGRVGGLVEHDSAVVQQIAPN